MTVIWTLLYPVQNYRYKKQRKLNPCLCLVASDNRCNGKVVLVLN